MLYIVQSRWCWDCTELLIKINTYIADDSQVTGDYVQHLFQNILEDLRPQLDWMEQLTSLVIVRGSSQDSFEDGNLIRGFLNYMMITQANEDIEIPQNDGLMSLERLWIDDQLVTREKFNQLGENYLPAPEVKSIVLPEEIFWDGYPHVLDNGRYQHLEHLADVVFFRLAHLANLKYIRGRVFDLKVISLLIY